MYVFNKPFVKIVFQYLKQQKPGNSLNCMTSLCLLTNKDLYVQQKLKQSKVYSTVNSI